jgi:crotonobetainyl-CoA:carnitine CoA-transferase CaiB-like acyl-CoA transferase
LATPRSRSLTCHNAASFRRRLVLPLPLGEGRGEALRPIADYYTGMLCAFSIMTALHYRNRTGKGQYIDLALLDSLVLALDNLGERYTVGAMS